MSAQAAATRLRRTFQYPSESDDEDAVEAGMDAQGTTFPPSHPPRKLRPPDQADLLTNLSTHDTRTTSTYTHLLLALPLLPIALYIPLLFRLSSLPAAGLAIPSLLASAYTLYFLPLPPIRISVAHVSDLQSSSARSKPAETKTERRPVPYLSGATAELVAQWVVAANGLLCAVLAVAEVLQGRPWGEGMTVGGGYLPGLVFAVVMFARRELRAVDMSELERLQHQGKST
jgi:UDP:flavonoid glycosyltransferase YjiC (YdhE family)